MKVGDIKMELARYGTPNDQLKQRKPQLVQLLLNLWKTNPGLIQNTPMETAGAESDQEEREDEAET